MQSRQQARRIIDAQGGTEPIVGEGEQVTLGYEVRCAGPCSPQGTLHVRRAKDSDFDEIPLRIGLNPSGTHLGAIASVPASYTNGAGFDYYATIDDKHGNAITVPEGGAAAPQHAWVVSHWTKGELGQPRVGGARSPDAVLVEAAWGKGDDNVGLYRERGLPLYGPSAFDVSEDGSIVLLDQLNDRLSFYSPENPDDRRHSAISFAGLQGDLALDGNGTIYVLDPRRNYFVEPRKNTRATVRSFTEAGKLLATTELVSGTQQVPTLQIGPHGAIALRYPGPQWVPVGAGRNLLEPSEQEAGTRQARTFPSGQEVVVSGPNERFALVRGEHVERAWEISAVVSGRVVLVENYRNGLLVIVGATAYPPPSGSPVELWQVVQLTPNGIALLFSIKRDHWGDYIPGPARFRLRCESLYELESRQQGVRIVRFDLGPA